MNVKMEQQINHALVATFLDNFSINYFVIDRNGSYIYKNSALADVVGDTMQADSVNNKAWISCQEVMNTGESTQIDEEHEGRWYTSIKKPLYNVEINEIIGVIGISIDITDRKKAEQLKIEKEAALKVAEFTNMISGVIAHELRTPITSIGLQMDLLNNCLLLRGRSTKGKITTGLKTVHAVKFIVDSASQMINDLLLKIKSFATGKIEKVPAKKHSIMTDISAIVASYPFVRDERKLIEVDDEHDFEYLGDANLTKHVFTNLIKNSIRAITESGKGEILIMAKKAKKPEDKFNQLIFRDTASGIPQKFLNRIFENFNTMHAKTGGTGLGLAFCKMVMQSYGGDITCQSQEGKFTEFTLTFPRLCTSS